MPPELFSARTASTLRASKAIQRLDYLGSFSISPTIKVFPHGLLGTRVLTAKAEQLLQRQEECDDTATIEAAGMC